jgi:hypothetical protein
MITFIARGDQLGIEYVTTEPFLLRNAQILLTYSGKSPATSLVND